MGSFVVKNRIIYGYKNKFLLIHDNWNDYWEYETLYELYYFDSNGKIITLGEVKIADIRLQGVNSFIPQIPSEFDALDEKFFSVGQTEEYYSNIYENLEKMPVNPFVSLNDVAYNLNLLSQHLKKDIMQKSLLRNVSVTTVKRQFNRIAQGGVVLTPYNFTYMFNVNYEDENMGKNNMEFNVEVDSTPPSNIHVLIGRNGVGKSKLLNDMINVYLEKDDARGCFLDDKMECKIPSDIFPNLIYMSYSAFDNTENVDDYYREDDEKRYVYLGLRKKITDGSNVEFINKNLDDLACEFVDSLITCKSSKNKYKRLKKLLLILESDPIFKQADISSLIEFELNDENQKNIKNFYKRKLSSGHGIILLTIVRLVEMLEEKTLVLLDEPETHLHPPLLSSYIYCLSELLKSRNAVAIIATHSPVILQEVPRKCVWKLNRSGYVSSITRPQLETFGESYSSLVEDVFGLEIQESGYHKLIATEVRKLESYDEFVNKFNNQLGSDADVIARTLFLMKREDFDEN